MFVFLYNFGFRSQNLEKLEYGRKMLRVVGYFEPKIVFIRSANFKGQPFQNRQHPVDNPVHLFAIGNSGIRGVGNSGYRFNNNLSN